MDRKEDRPSRFIFPSGTSKAQTHPHAQDPISPATSVASSAQHRLDNSKEGYDVSDEPDAGLTRGLRYETHRPRTPPKQVSRIGPLAGDSRATAAAKELSAVAASAALHGKGVRAPRNRGALADLFPDQFADRGDHETGRSPDERDIRNNSTATDTFETSPDDAVRGASHELSWTAPRDGRDGLVDQMLNTFDQLDDNFAGNSSYAAPIFYADPDKYHLGSRPESRSRRPRGHTYSSSTSSVVPFQSSEALSGRGAHSRNKSSVGNFTTGLERVDSIRLVTDRRPSTQGASRARRLSKSSIVSGHGDATPATLAGASSRKQRQQVRRSASFDQSIIRSVLASSTTVLRDPVTMNEYDDLNAAPEPSVRPGPRRFGESNAISSVGSQALRGRENNKDGGRTLTGLRRHGVSPQRIDSLQSDEPRNSSAAGYRDAPPISSSRLPPAPSSYQATAFSTNVPAGKEKEKGGFFKRMFGGGSKTSSTQSLAAAATAQSSMSTDNIALQRQQSTEQMAPGRGRQTKTQPSEERQQSVSSRHHVPVAQNPETMVPPTPRSKSESKETPTLTKKSSFFRRRKKSVASAAPAVPKLPDSSTWSNGPHRDHSPASSLRNVMTPYLSSRPGTRVGQPGSKDDRTEDGRAPISPIMTDFQGQPESRDETTGGTPAAPRTSDSRPRRSTSKGQTRPNFKRGPHGDSSSSKPTAYEIARNDPDASELSDADFISAKSHVNSPVDEQPPEMFRPPAPTAAPPKVPTDGPASRAAKARYDLDPGTTPTHPPASVAMPTRGESESETVQPAEEDYETGYRLFRFNSEPPTDDPSLPMNESDICAWLGEAGPERARVRKAYMELFDWKDTSILTALRKFCEHTRLAGETQQVDRVLEGIARRWTECNPSHGFKIVDVVHAICYSLILLNTDLHLADIEKRMTKAQFVKNTLRTCLKNIDDTDPDAFKGMETVKAKRVSRLIPGLAPPLDLSKVETNKNTNNLEVPRSPHSPTLPAAPAPESGTVKLTIRRNSNEFQKNKFRLSARPSDNYALENLLGNLPPKDENETPPPKAAAPPDVQDDCGPLVKQPFLGGRTAWEAQVEAVLKTFYTSVQKQRLPLQDSTDRSRAPSSIGQTTGGATSVRRTPSIASRQSDGRGRNLESRGTVGGTASSRWTSRHRGNKPRLYAASNISLDDELSMSGMSPSTSSLWSKHSFGRTQTSMSVQSFGSEAPGHEAYQQSIGFANALSQAIIREEGGTGAGDESDGEALKAAPLLDDESLELYGAPWAKEGTVKHKHHLEAVDKKAKERAWTECFAVIEKGWLRLFRFNSAKTASLRSKTLRAAVSGVGSSSRSIKSGNSGQKLVVGGGNWMDNALPLGRFLLRQTIASPLPPPGYSKSRPHVWALSLPNGAVHLFQAGTPEIVREYVTCANYWSARLSKEPLTGGVSSLEYGWSESLLGDLIASSQPTGSRASSRDGPGTQAQQSSLADVFGSKRQRSTSNSSTTTQVPNIPPRTASRSFARPPSAMHSSRPSLQTSIRSSFETTASAVGAVRPRLAGDHVKIADWTPPPQSMMASALLEVDQLRVLSDYVANVKKDLEKHNQLRPAIAQAYNPRHPNYARAMANFEKKSAYLLREIVKFTTYVESLQSAQVRRDDVNREREQRKRDLADMKVETAEELRRELSKSDLRKAAQYSAYDDDDDDVPEVPEVPKALMNLIT